MPPRAEEERNSCGLELSAGDLARSNQSLQKLDERLHLAPSILRLFRDTHHQTEEMPKSVLAGNMFHQFIEEQSARHPLQMENVPRIMRFLLENGIELLECDCSIKKRTQQLRHLLLRMRPLPVDVSVQRY